MATPDAATPQVADAANPQQPAAPQQQFSFFHLIRSLAMNMAIMYFITSFFRGQQQSSPATSSSSTPQRLPSTNMFVNGTMFDLYAYVSESETFNDFSKPDALVWKHENLVYGDWTSGASGDGIYTHRTTIAASDTVCNNGSLYLHVYVVKAGLNPNPEDKMYDKFASKPVHKQKMLTRYKKLKYSKTHNLLTGETAASPEIVKKAENISEEILSHWHPNLTINIVDDHTQWVKGAVPSPLDEFIDFDEFTGKYYPIVFLNNYWNLLREYQPVNESTTTLNLTLTFQPLTLFKWQLYTAQSMRSRWNYAVMGESLMQDEEDQDSLKEAVLETNPYLLGMTVIISILHSIFEFLAFKNDIQFWNNRTSLEGLSVRSVFFNVFQSLIVLLYVLDNETNTVVRISVFVGLVIEIWKIHKVVDFRVNRENKILGILPRIWIKDKGSYVQSSTKQYDMLAFRYLSWALFPLLFGYAIYSLLYLEHKGWYSWVLSMLYGFLLTFGFIMMTPQLFINYKLKSVAHLPWRMMTYKALNTFIDDIFAFVIKMPTMYRLGCFRDDIVFFIYLYQRWIYRVDPTRVNEFGTSAEMERSSETTPAVMAAEESVSNGEANTADPEPLPSPKTQEDKKQD